MDKYNLDIFLNNSTIETEIMKNFVCMIALATTAFLPLVAPAELLVYKGTIKEAYTGENNSLRVNSRLFLIIDHETANVARLEYATVDGIKQYRTTQMTNMHVLQVTSANGKAYSVLSRTPTDCDAVNEPTNEGVFAKGANATLTVTTNSTTLFPKTLTGGGDGLFYSGASGQPVLVQGSLVVAFNKTETVASNSAGETLDTALARFVSNVESLGYTR